MKFNKEYIEEADCPEIQNLREELKHGDWTYYGGNEHIVVCDSPIKFREFWIPTGDQLDDEIERICKEKYEWYNWIYHTESGLDSSKTKMRYYAFIVDNQERPICGDTCIIVYNPLIAKILLLKQLLKEQ